MRYTVIEDKPVVVSTKTLGNNGVQDTSYAFYDGFLRALQTQAPVRTAAPVLAEHLLR